MAQRDVVGMKLTRGRLVLIDLECQLDGCHLDSPMSGTPLGVSARVLPEVFIWGKMTHPQSGKQCAVDGPDVGRGLRQREPVFTSWASASAVAAATLCCIYCLQLPCPSYQHGLHTRDPPEKFQVSSASLWTSTCELHQTDFAARWLFILPKYVLGVQINEPPTAKNDTSYLLAVCLILLQLLQPGELRQQKLSLQDHEIDNQEQGIYRLGCNWSLFLSL